MRLERQALQEGNVWGWSHTSPPPTYSGSYWYWDWTLPLTPLGRWNFRAVYQGTTYNHGFNVLSPGDLIFQDGFQLGL